MKQTALIIMLSVVGFAVALAVFIANRLAAEEVALLAGVVCGISAAIPLGLLAGAAMGLRRGRDQSAATALPVIYVSQPPQPNVVGVPRTLDSVVPTSRLTTPAARPLNIIGQNEFDPDK